MLTSHGENFKLGCDRSSDVLLISKFGFWGSGICHGEVKEEKPKTDPCEALAFTFQQVDECLFYISAASSAGLVKVREIIGFQSLN